MFDGGGSSAVPFDPLEEEPTAITPSVPAEKGRTKSSQHVSQAIFCFCIGRHLKQCFLLLMFDFCLKQAIFWFLHWEASELICPLSSFDVRRLPEAEEVSEIAWLQS